MYSNKLAAAIKIGGKVLRESDGTVYLPFGSEYSIYLKNMNSVRASVKIEIDGQDVTEGVALIVDANDDVELQRSIKGGNLNQGNRFKFIERTGAIEQHRGVNVSDGIVRIEFQYEKELDYYVKSADMFTRRISPHGDFYNTSDFSGKLACGSTWSSTDISGAATAQAMGAPGITVPGSVSDQRLSTVRPFSLESKKHVIVLNLLGEVQGKQVSTYVTSRMKLKCQTCGYVSKSMAKFCSQCGTSLEII